MATMMSNGGDGFGFGDGWIVDSGASHHMCPHLEWFEGGLKESSIKEVKLGNKAAVEVRGEGSVRVVMPKGGHAILTRVLYVPSLDLNILVVPYLTSKGIEVVFKDRGCEWRRDGKVLARGWSKGGSGLVTMEFTTCLVNSTSMVQVKASTKTSASSTQVGLCAMAVGAPSDAAKNQAVRRRVKEGGGHVKWKRVSMMDARLRTSPPIPKPRFGAMDSGNVIRPARGRRGKKGSGGQRMAEKLRGALGHNWRSRDNVEEDEALEETRMETIIIALCFMLALRFNVFVAEPLGSWLFANG